MKRITAVGSLNVDLVVRAPRAPEAGETVAGESLARHPGGKGANQAAAAARACPPDASIAVSMIGRVGSDSDGDFVRGALTTVGVDVTGVARDDTLPTGIAAITVSATSGDNRIVHIAGANAAFTPGLLGQHHDTLAGANVLLLQLEVPLPTVQTAARMGREKHAIVILDPAPARPLPAALLRLCDFVTPNLGELATLLGARAGGPTLPHVDAFPASLAAIADDARRLLGQGARNVVVKLGAAGVLLVSPAGAWHVPAFAVTAVDSTAAGDTWNGAFAVALCEGKPARAAAVFANAAAALSVTRAGAQSSLPTRPEIDALAALAGSHAD